MKRWKTILSFKIIERKWWVNRVRRRRLEPVMMRSHDDRSVFRPEGLTTRPHIDLYLSGDFLSWCVLVTLWKQKKINVCHFPGKLDLVKKIPVPLIAWYDDTHSYKIPSLRFHKQKNEREVQVFLPKPNIPFNNFFP